MPLHSLSDWEDHLRWKTLFGGWCSRIGVGKTLRDGAVVHGSVLFAALDVVRGLLHCLTRFWLRKSMARMILPVITIALENVEVRLSFPMIGKYSQPLVSQSPQKIRTLSTQVPRKCIHAYPLFQALLKVIHVPQNVCVSLSPS